MKYILLLSLFNSLYASCQIWKEPFDTLEYIDSFEKLADEKTGIKSYSITQFDEKDSILSYDYYGFNKEGYLIEQFYAMYPDQHTDTNKFHYENGIVQGSDFKREHIYNENNRLIEVRNSKQDSTWSTHYVYEDNRLTEIRYSSKNWETFDYDTHGKIVRKEIFKHGKLKEYFNYQHPSEKVLIYQHCLLNEKGNPYLPCEVTEGYFDEKNRLIQIVLKYGLDSSNVFVVKSEYDQQGNVRKVTDQALHDTELGSEVIYVRDKKGLLLKTEHYQKGKIYLYARFDYVYY